jgi:AcrR family transcriptional regulator
MAMEVICHNGYSPPMPRIDRRKQLLLVARRLFAKEGYHGASIDDVIQKAGVARGTFYNYFDNKRALFQAVLEELFELVWQSVPPIEVGPGQDVRAQIVGNLISLCTLLETEPDVPRILLAGSSGIDPEADRALGRFYASCRARLAKALAHGQGLGIVGPGDPTALAICIMGIMKEYWSQVMLGTKPPPIDEFLRELHRVFESGWLRAGGAGTPRAQRRKA